MGCFALRMSTSLSTAWPGPPALKKCKTFTCTGNVCVPLSPSIISTLGTVLSSAEI